MLQGTQYHCGVRALPGPLFLYVLTIPRYEIRITGVFSYSTLQNPTPEGYTAFFEYLIVRTYGYAIRMSTTLTQKAPLKTYLVKESSLFIGMVLLAVLLGGCLEDPARTHPLDPLGEGFVDEGALQVEVTTLYPPVSGLSEALVSIDPGNIAGKTDAAGRFLVSELASGAYTITVDLSGYAQRDTTINLTAGSQSRIRVSLPGLPAITDVRITSLHVSRWFPPPEELFSIEIQTTISDPDGTADLERVWLFIDEFQFTDDIPVQVEPGVFVHSVTAATLPVSLEAVLGHGIRIWARDRSGEMQSSEPQNIVRVIRETPLTVAPQGLELLSDPQPQFVWESVPVTFPHTYRLDVVRISQNIQTPVAQVTGIPPADTSFQARDPLPAGDYFWTVSVVDEFGNRSRSREAGFSIQ